MIPCSDSRWSVGTYLLYLPAGQLIFYNNSRMSQVGPGIQMSCPNYYRYWPYHRLRPILPLWPVLYGDISVPPYTGPYSHAPALYCPGCWPAFFSPPSSQISSVPPGKLQGLWGSLLWQSILALYYSLCLPASYHSLLLWHISGRYHNSP